VGFSPFSGFNVMFSIIPIIVVVGFIFVFGMIIFRAVQGASRWKKNNDSPVLTVDATVVTKREDVSTYHHDAGADGMHTTSSSTTYYVTFQVPSGDRMEFEVRDTEFGMLVEQDMGKLTFQGTRYLGFTRLRG
jgi:hypothetical protein